MIVRLLLLISCFLILKTNIVKFHSQVQSQVKIKETWKRNSEAQKGELLILKEVFDRRGQKIKETAYDKNQLPLTTTDWELNEIGDCISQKIKYEDSNNKTEFYFDNEYKNNRKVKVIKYDADKNYVQESIFKYDSFIEETILVSGEISRIKVYELENQLVISEVNMANNMKRDYKYDDYGTIMEVREKRLNRPDKLIQYQNKYNKENRLISQRKGDEVNAYEYNEQGYADKRTTLKNDQVIEVLRYSYTYYSP